MSYLCTMSNLLYFFTGTLLENVRVRYIKRCCCFAVEEVLKIDLLSQERATCSKSAVGLLPCSHQADIRMCSHCLLRLDDNKSLPGLMQVDCQDFLSTSLMQVVSITCSSVADTRGGAKGMQAPPPNNFY